MNMLFLILSRKQLFIIYKKFVRPHSHADIIDDKSFNDSLKEKLEKFYFSVVFIITGLIKGTSRERF